MVIILEIIVFHKMKLSRDANNKKWYRKLIYLCENDADAYYRRIQKN